MRYRGVVLLVAVFLGGSTAWADNVTPQQNQSASSCGRTAADAIAQARKLLSIADAGSERAALVCLTEATADVDAHVRALDSIRTSSGMVHIIDADLPPQ